MKLQKSLLWRYVFRNPVCMLSLHVSNRIVEAVTYSYLTVHKLSMESSQVVPLNNEKVSSNYCFHPISLKRDTLVQFFLVRLAWSRKSSFVSAHVVWIVVTREVNAFNCLSLLIRRWYKTAFKPLLTISTPCIYQLNPSINCILLPLYSLPHQLRRYDLRRQHLHLFPLVNNFVCPSRQDERSFVHFCIVVLENLCFLIRGNGSQWLCKIDRKSVV